MGWYGILRRVYVRYRRFRPFLIFSGLLDLFGSFNWHYRRKYRQSSLLSWHSRRQYRQAGSVAGQARRQYRQPGIVHIVDPLKQTFLS